VNEAKARAPRNRTITLSDAEKHAALQQTLNLNQPCDVHHILDRIICQDLFAVVPFLPDQFVDLMIIDPPYNLNKTFHDRSFRQMDDSDYVQWVERWLSLLIHVLKPNASVYVCGDWQSSPLLYSILKRHFHVRNRITWEREKGRGAKKNWKNAAEDIWFCTLNDHYTFHVDQVMLKRRVIAPYREDGQPKDWIESEDGNYRLTHPSNLWTDLTVPFWSMPENTDHPTQKPEKLIAKLILASSNPGDVVFDPFLGSGTSAVVAKKLERHFVGVEIDSEYCGLAQKRLTIAEDDPSIQGYHNGVFWERNTLAQQKAAVEKKKPGRPRKTPLMQSLFAAENADE